MKILESQLSMKMKTVIINLAKMKAISENG